MGVLAGGAARSAALGTLDTLSACGGMAGTDPAGRRWADRYDEAAAAAIRASQDVINACCVVAQLLEQTGFNYAHADAASAGVPPPDRTAYLGQLLSLSAPPPAAGATRVGPPTGWSLIQAAVGHAWPNGHQDRMRRAAAAWHDGACFLYDAAGYLADAVAQLAQQIAPETDDVIAVCNCVRDALEATAVTYKALGTACTEYAAQLDAARSSVEHELVDLLEWTAGIEVAGALLAVFTLGGSEVASQATVAARVGLTAGRVAGTLDRLAATAVAACDAVGLLAARCVEVARMLNPVLRLKRVAATVDTIELARASSAAQRAYLAELDGAATAASVDLAAVPTQAREEVLAALARARSGKVRFPGHDGKDFHNDPPLLPVGPAYTEWTAAAPGRRRGDIRVIFAGDEANPSAIYFWDHLNPPIKIGP